MIRKIKQILALTILAVTSASCSMALLNDEESSLNGEYTIVVNGIVSDVASNDPLLNFRITFTAYAENSLSVMPLITKTAYTDARGAYNFKISGFSEPVTCEIKAECPEKTAQYEPMTNKIMVTWSGSSFDPDQKTFFVNDCNFQMNPSTL